MTHRRYPLWSATILLVGFITAAPAAESVADKKVDVPSRLLVLKYDPALISDRTLRNELLQQIGDDQREFRARDGNMKRYQTAKPVLFKREQVKDRVAKFLVSELMPEYRKHLVNIATRIPKRLHFSKDMALNWITYEKGLLKEKNSEPPVLISMNIRSKSEKLKNLPDLGSRTVIAGDVRLSATMPDVQFPPRVKSWSTGIELALDRKPFVPALKMSASEAERLWKMPKMCSSPPFTLDADKRRKAQAELLRCRKRTKYTSNVRAEFEIEIEGLVSHGKHQIFQAKLIGATVYGPRENVLASLTAADFPVGPDVWAEEAARKADDAKAKAAADAAKLQERKSVEQAQGRALEGRREALRAADVLGIRLGMSVTDAEKKIRKEVEVGWVGELEKPEGPYGVLDPNRPYDQPRLFYSRDLKNAIVLWEHDGRVVAVGRTIHLPKTVSEDTIRKPFLDRYGTPSRGSSRELAWAASFGVDSNRGKAATELRDGSCDANLSSVGPTGIRFMKEIQTNSAVSSTAPPVRPRCGSPEE